MTQLPTRSSLVATAALALVMLGCSKKAETPRPSPVPVPVVVASPAPVALPAPEGAVAGAGAGGVLGGTLGLLAGIGALAIPGFGPFIAAGPLLAALSGAAAGATVGGVTGALVGMGIPEIEAKRYEGKIKGGNILISVHSENSDEQKRAEAIFKKASAQDICATTEASVPNSSKEPPRSTV